MNVDKKKVRLSLVVTADLNDTLTQLAEKTGETKSDVLRKAITLMEMAVDARQRGRKVGIVEKDQTVMTEIVGI
jgi:predicted transcriptional regulator